MSLIVSNRFKLELGRGNVDFDTDEFRVILMASGYTFSAANHNFYSDISSQELPNGYGYTKIDAILTTLNAWAIAGTLARIDWNDYTWTAAAGDIGPTVAAVVIRHNSVTPADSVVVGAITFSDPVTVADGLVFVLREMGFDLGASA